MKKILFGSIVLIMGLGLTGCGNSTPEEVAETFANAMSNIDMKKAKEFSTEHVKDKIAELSRVCMRKDINNLADIAMPILNLVHKKLRHGKYDDQLGDALRQYKENSERIMKKFEKETKEKYGQLKDNKEEVMQQVYNELLEAYSVASMPLIEKEFELLDIKSKQIEDVKKVASFFIINGSYRVTYGNKYEFMKSVNKVIFDKGFKLTPKCIDEYTEFGFIDAINIIEVKENSPDQMMVRLEIIREDGKSNKVSVEVEKIQDNWKVSDLYIDTDF